MWMFFIALHYYRAPLFPLSAVVVLIKSVRCSRPAACEEKQTSVFGGRMVRIKEKREEEAWAP